MPEPLRVLAIEPYFGLSHRIFLEGFQARSRHQVEIWHMPARKWKWRMRGSAYHFARRAAELEAAYRPDVVLASDFLNLADWRALSPASYRAAPVLLYFHENQITYPLSEEAPVDHHYGWINLSSALAADRILFNSAYHRELFLREVERILARMPDFVPPGLAGGLRARSGVFPVGIDFEPHEKLARERSRGWSSEPVILWNHRWEYDKAPERFVEALIELARRGVPFRTIVCGESFGKSHPAFERAVRELGDRILHLGFFREAGVYRKAAAGADVVVSTARHEFFGVSVVEAMFLGCLPVLPNALSYPEIIPPHLHPLFLYGQDEALADFLAAFLREPPLRYVEELREAAAAYHWKHLAPRLDSILEGIALERGRPL
jgi:glycosyltransferase involved in cell wall biosynthesis